MLTEQQTRTAVEAIEAVRRLENESEREQALVMIVLRIAEQGAQNTEAEGLELYRIRESQR